MNSIGKIKFKNADNTMSEPVLRFRPDLASRLAEHDMVWSEQPSGKVVALSAETELAVPTSAGQVLILDRPERPYETIPVIESAEY